MGVGFRGAWKPAVYGAWGPLADSVPGDVGVDAGCVADHDGIGAQSGELRRGYDGNVSVAASGEAIVQNG